MARYKYAGMLRELRRASNARETHVSAEDQDRYSVNPPIVALLRNISIYVIAWGRVKLVFNFTRVFKVSQKIARVAQRRG